MRTLVNSMLRLYQRFISPYTVSRCRYYPTCSEYARQSVTQLGFTRGVPKALWRLLRCNPFSKGGLDPVEQDRSVK